MGWSKGSKDKPSQSTKDMADVVKSSTSKSKPEKGSPFSSKPGKGPGRYSGKKK